VSTRPRTPCSSRRFNLDHHDRPDGSGHATIVTGGGVPVIATAGGDAADPDETFTVTGGTGGTGSTNGTHLDGGGGSFTAATGGGGCSSGATSAADGNGATGDVGGGAGTVGGRGRGGAGAGLNGDAFGSQGTVGNGAAARSSSPWRAAWLRLGRPRAPRADCRLDPGGHWERG
jgi:hypothetical protein